LKAFSLCKSFFDDKYQTPDFLKNNKLTRRAVLKSAAGATAVTAMPAFSFKAADHTVLASIIKTDPWLTLDATLNHLLPASKSESAPESDISAEKINATAYLYNIMTVQPTEAEEKEFILKGVGWLNGFAQSQKSKAFVELTTIEKEQLLRGISSSRAGQNWLNTLLGYIFEAMLAPPSYGGQPKGEGWQWLEHKAGFPLPKKGQQYFDLPPRAKAKKPSNGKGK
jgi:gluconate 2-dehydrogenase gamma chain